MARCRRVVSSRRAAPLIKRRRRERDAPADEEPVTCRGSRAGSGRVAAKRGFINLSIGVVRRHVRFGVVHEGYNHEPGAKGVVATLHARESFRRTGSSAACGDRRGKGCVIASRGFNRTRSALKQYEYPICEITKTGLLPPGVINTGEFVHHRACGVWAGGRRDAPLFYRCLSLTNWLSRRYADVPGVTAWLRARRTAHASCTATSPELRLQRDARPWRAN